MIYGVVNLRREATLPLVVGNAEKQHQVVDTVIDTGFNGFLSLPSTVIATLNLPWSASAMVIWDGQYREIDIAASETEPLLGMAMLYGYRLQVDNVEGGIVKIEKL
jgi:predicted aspartyl protease